MIRMSEKPASLRCAPDEQAAEAAAGDDDFRMVNDRGP